MNWTILRKEKTLLFAYGIVGMFAFTYVFIRAIQMGATYDEAWTINEFVPQSFYDIVRYGYPDANNHLINTLSIKLLFLSGNETLFIARLPNVFAFLAFIFFSYKIAFKYFSWWLGISCFTLLLLNPFLIDFFSIARGYGIGLGFLMISLYYSLEYIRSGLSKKVIGALGFGAFAVLCNFSILNYWLSAVFVINAVALFTKSKYKFKSTFFYSLAVTILLFLAIFNPLRKLIANNSLYYGGEKDFYTDTLGSLTNHTLYKTADESSVFFWLNLFLIVLAVALIFSFMKNKEIFSIKNFILGMIVVCILSNIVQHYLFGTLYLIDRTALFYYPLFILLLSFSFEEVSTSIISKIMVVVVFAFGLNFIKHANLYKTTTWSYDSHSTKILTQINEEGKRQNKIMKIDFSWPFRSVFYYYMRSGNYQNLEVVKPDANREELNFEADYYVYLSESHEKVGYWAENQEILKLQKDTVQEFKTEHILIFNHLR